MEQKITDFVALDFETANEARSSICQMALVKIVDGTIADTREWYIRPKELRFSEFNTFTHGISYNNVKDCPEFPQIWEQALPWIEGQIIVAHNASFDVYALKEVLTLYNIPLPEFRYFCTLAYSKDHLQLNKHSLPAVCKCLDIDFSGHHNAKYDALACAKIALKFLDGDVGLKIFPTDLHYGNNFGIRHERSYFIQQLPKADLTGINIYDLSETITPEMFKGKGVVVTGQFSKITREQAEEYVLKMGAALREAVSGKTSLVVMGTDAGPSKIEKIKELNKTKFIPVIDETEFIEVLEALALL